MILHDYYHNHAPYDDTRQFSLVKRKNKNLSRFVSTKNRRSAKCSPPLTSNLITYCRPPLPSAVLTFASASIILYNSETVVCCLINTHTHTHSNSNCFNWYVLFCVCTLLCLFTFSIINSFYSTLYYCYCITNIRTACSYLPADTLN
jgi:hypothetical protein